MWIRESPPSGLQAPRGRRKRKRKKQLRVICVEAKEDMNNVLNKEGDGGRAKYETLAKISSEAAAEKDMETLSLIAKIVISEKTEEIGRASDRALLLKGDEVEGRSTKGANSDSSNSVMLHDITSNPDIIRNNVSGRRRRRKGKKKLHDFSEYNLVLGGRSRIDVPSENILVVSTGIEDNGLRTSLDEYLPNGRSICPQMCMNLCHANYPFSIQSEVEAQENGKRSNFLNCDVEQYHEGVPSTQLQIVECGDIGSADEKRDLVSGSISHAADISSLDVSVSVSVGRGLVESIKKKLLVLDLNGLLADICEVRGECKPHKKVGGKSVFKRPFCDIFLNFCFERFAVGVWSSRKKTNVDKVVDYLMADFKDKLLFCWDQSKCTSTRSKTLEDKNKPLVLKELKKLWNKDEPTLPWEIGAYSPSNTLLVDDSPYKALCNPPHTAIFPKPYDFNNENDNSLGPEGDLVNYLEGVAIAHDVQHYVQHYPFGQPAITEKSPFWYFYLDVINKLEKSSASA